METSSVRENEQLPISVRHASEEDVNFLFHSWLRSYRDSSFAKDVSTDHYYSSHKRLVSGLLARCQVYVACNPTDVEQIYGFMAWERIADVLVVHYAYVKYSFRHLGVARRLWASVNPTDEPTLCTHAGKSFGDLRRAGYPISYDPYSLFRLT
jgi:hypothetical protein